MSSTPIAQSKTSALTRILDSIPKGYCRFTKGQVKVEKAKQLIEKLHAKHKVGISPAARSLRKKQGKANAVLVFYWPENATLIEWLMLFTAGELDDHENLQNVVDKPRLQFLGYELVRYANGDKSSWTWRRPKTEMAELYAFLVEKMNNRNFFQVHEALIRIAMQPGFHGVREQSWQLCEFVRRRGYKGELPYLFFVSKVSHGTSFPLN